jgi:ABC-2 type transport system ATP-binding protein
MSDVERIADHVAIVHQGRLLLMEELDRLKECARRIVVRGMVPPDLPDVVRVSRSGGETRLTVLARDAGSLEALRKDGVWVEPLTLEDLFVDLVEGGGAHAAA